jgi:glucosamine--fructose-6-phosphate aminotransferase (isomerizing)
MPFVNRLAELNLPVALEDASELLHYTFQAYGRSTVFVLISRSGDTIEITRLASRIKSLGATLIGVANVPGSRLAAQADIFLNLSCPPDELIAIQTYTATLLLMQMLAEQIAGWLDQPGCRRQLQDALDGVAKAKETYQRLSEVWRPEIRPYSSIYLLARGSSRASACEGQLLFHEMAWSQATFYSAGHFRHGPWEVVEDGFLGFVFAPEDECYDLNINLALDLARMKGEVRLITSRVPPGLPQRVVPWPVAASEPGLAPLLEILPVQFFVYEFALSRGRQPGIFRASTPITLTEDGRRPSEEV